MTILAHLAKAKNMPHAYLVRIASWSVVVGTSGSNRTIMQLHDR
ncbi:hypothetical protein ACLB1N_21470 [Escherichia coli]